ncbi:ATP synthase F1 subunit epsilon [Pelagibacteraceae bacterium]|jgi:F-type H+-transporting ATPase subunit epsilon|nr:ATP synthase F1 subunit epsilon [Pelagibacteraceae bacterium]|tara:strand:- start:3 stop:392 length:390 start_codon:yes stop_codon:yes gene_type:complete
MSENFLVEIISPDKSILKSEAIEVTIPAYEGQIGILKDHIPLITFLRPGIVVIKKNDEEKSFFVEDGTVEFVNNNLLILSTSAKSLDNFNKESIDILIKDSQEKINNAESNDKEKYLLSHKIDVLREIN